jgi:uncharacterized protein (DUF2267 family)
VNTLQQQNDNLATEKIDIAIGLLKSLQAESGLQSRERALAITKFAIGLLESLQAESGLQSRERALAITKLEEAGMWLSKIA